VNYCDNELGVALGLLVVVCSVYVQSIISELDIYLYACFRSARPESNRFSATWASNCTVCRYQRA